MQQYIFLNIEKLPEGYYLATSNQVQGLIAQGKTIEETIEIAQDLSKELLIAQKNNLQIKKYESFIYPMLVTA